jgi:hypothetical protein
MERVQSPRAPGHVLTFSSITKASDYLIAQGATNWEFTLVVRPGIREFLLNLTNEGVTGICHDLGTDGSGEIYSIHMLTKTFGM